MDTLKLVSLLNLYLQSSWMTLAAQAHPWPSSVVCYSWIPYLLISLSKIIAWALPALQPYRRCFSQADLWTWCYMPDLRIYLHLNTGSSNYDFWCTSQHNTTCISYPDQTKGRCSLTQANWFSYLECMNIRTRLKPAFELEDAKHLHMFERYRVRRDIVSIL